MKRYTQWCSVTHKHGMNEHERGEWVRYEDAATSLAEAEHRAGAAESTLIGANIQLEQADESLAQVTAERDEAQKRRWTEAKLHDGWRREAKRLESALASARARLAADEQRVELAFAAGWDARSVHGDPDDPNYGDDGAHEAAWAAFAATRPPQETP